MDHSHTHLCIVTDCFWASGAELRSCNRNKCPEKSNVFCLAHYRVWWPLIQSKVSQTIMCTQITWEACLKAHMGFFSEWCQCFRFIEDLGVRALSTGLCNSARAQAIWCISLVSRITTALWKPPDSWRINHFIRKVLWNAPQFWGPHTFNSASL